MRITKRLARLLVRSFVLAACIATLAAVAVAVPSAPTAFAGYAQGHDNSTNPAHAQSWTHADPNVADPPGDGRLGSNYYYLKIDAAGPEVVCTVASGGNWEIAVEDGKKNVLAHSWPLTSGGQVFITNAKVGALYMCRISDLGTTPLKDYAQLDSGAVGAVGCGGPGPVVDPNWNAAPMQPLANSQVQCAALAPYTPGDPRLAPPPAQTAALGPIKGGAVYPFTITAACDLTAGAFYGHQGSKATLTITDTSGAVVNGVKWGAMESNPRSETQEYVGADAGVLAPGTYDVHYAGPGNNQDVYAICQGM